MSNYFTEGATNNHKWLILNTSIGIMIYNTIEYQLATLTNLRPPNGESQLKKHKDNLS